MSFFTEVIQPDPRFLSTSRIADLALLEPVFRGKVQRIVIDAASQGIVLSPFETYRSQTRQELLFAQGATKLKTVGVHHFGLACDLVQIVEGEWSWKPSYAFLGPLALKYGLVWGGDWGEPTVQHKFVDADHVQAIAVEDQGRLFNGSWYPDLAV
jgi:hypothetical protein